MAIKTILAVTLAATLTLTACTMPNFVPAHDQSPEEAAAARLDCTAVSEGLTPPQGGGFVAASGRPAFVGAAMGGYAIGLAIAAGIRQQHKVNIYTDCMEAHGFLKAEK